ncbi:MAG: hypothetical protein WBD65_01295, partial [Methylocella sp.]
CSTCDGSKTGPSDISRLRAAQAAVLRLWNRTIVTEGEYAADMSDEFRRKRKRLIETFGPNQSGKFYNYGGREYPW